MWHARGGRAIGVLLERSRHRTAELASSLHSLSPLGVLARGYSLTTRSSDGAAVTNADQLKVGETIHTGLPTVKRQAESNG